MPELFVHRSTLGAPAAEVFAWHERPGAFERLVPPWERIELLEQTDGIRDGSRVVLRMRAGPFPFRWVALHEGYRPGERFVDRQVRGPFRSWVHEHRFEANGATSTLEDRIEYALPLEPLSRRLAGRRVRAKLERTFRWRHATTAADVAVHRGAAPMRVAILGAPDPLAAHLEALLTTGGHTLVASEDADGLVDFGSPSAPMRARELGARVVVSLAGTTDWRALERTGVRVVLLRLGAVLTARGSRLAPCRPGPEGSWIARDDALGAILHALRRPELAGPLDAAAPGTGPLDPARLIDSGYRFRTPDLEATRTLYLGTMGA